MSKCQYKYEAYYFVTHIKFACKEPTIPNSRFCFFHDKDRYSEYEQEASKRFKQIVKESISKKKPLECIGYHIPDVDFTELLPRKYFAIPVFFNDAKFYREASFSEIKFLDIAFFINTEFSLTTTFTDATFRKKAYFTRAKFSHIVWFNGSTFSDDTFFSNATFSEQTNFLGVTFSQKVYFPVVVFSGETIFIQVKFSKESDFSYATFSRTAYFEKAELFATNFSDAKFLQGASFPGVVFSGPANFSRVTFKEANFSDAKFLQGASFPGVVFSGPATFYETGFSQQVNFNNVLFSQGASFPGVVFSGPATFYGAKFQGEAYFLGTVFGGDTFFRYTTFEQPNKVTFDSSNLSHVSFADTDITRIRFGDKIMWGGKDEFTIIEEQWLEKKASQNHKMKARAQKELKQGGKQEAEKPRLANMLTAEIITSYKEELNTIQFEALVKGGTEPYQYSWAIGDDGERGKERTLLHTIEKAGLHTIKLNVTDSNGQTASTSYQFEALESIPDVSLGLALSVYRNLRENYEFRLRYDEAGKFFIKEMELKRIYREAPSVSNFKLILIRLYRILTKGDKYPLPEVTYHLEKDGPITRHFSLTGLYYHLSRYGESIKIPAIIGIIILALSTFFFSMQSNLTLEPGLPFFPSSNTTTSTFVGLERGGNTTHILEAFERSLVDFLPILPIGGEVRLGIIDYTVKIVGGVLTFGLLAIALRRKFERKYTR